MSRFEEFEVYVRTVEAGSLSGAAKQLKVAKSAVSRRLQALENRLGVQLLIRTTRKITMTDAGAALYQRAKALLADWVEAESSISETGVALAGTIRVAAPLTFGVSHLGPALLDFLKIHPEIDFDIDFSDRKIDLITDGIDLAIRIGHLADSSLIARRIAPINFKAAASPEFLSKHGTPKTIEDLKALPELRFSLRDKVTWQYVAPDGQTGEIELKPRLMGNNGDFLMNAAIAGEGVVLEPTFILGEALKRGDLVEILSGYEWDAISAYAVYPPTRHLSARVRALVDFLANRFGTSPYWDDPGEA